MDPKLTQSHVESWLPNLMYHIGPEGSTIVHEYQKGQSYLLSNPAMSRTLEILIS